MQGPIREELLREASTSTSNYQASVKERELRNLRMWSLNPSDPKLREIGPVSIVKNIFGFKELNNPTAEVFYTIMALWKYCPDSCRDAVWKYLEKGALHAIKFDGPYFVEFLRRLLDFPRRGVIDPRFPFFFDLVNEKVAQSCGARLRLPTDKMFGIERQSRQNPLPKYETHGRKSWKHSPKKTLVRASSKSNQTRMMPSERKRNTTPYNKETCRLPENIRKTANLGPEKEPLNDQTAQKRIATLTGGIDTSPPHQ